MFKRSLNIPEHIVAANRFSTLLSDLTLSALSSGSRSMRNALSSCLQSLSGISADSFSAASSALVSLSGMGPPYPFAGVLRQNSDGRPLSSWALRQWLRGKPCQTAIRKAHRQLTATFQTRVSFRREGRMAMRAPCRPLSKPRHTSAMRQATIQR